MAQLHHPFVVGKPFEESALRRWLAQLLLALHYLQHKGVLHVGEVRDIKTSNIFLCSQGYVQLGDFGLASVCDSGRASHDQSLVGTPHYMSPELLAAKGYHHPTDVWSLGCVMYELTALKPAFNAFNL
ncbi:NIMA (Never in mitosis a)-related kinase, partial [Haematococcus lacustris]